MALQLTLHSERLTLTPLEQDDSDLIVALWTDPAVVQHICDPSTDAEVRRAMADAVKRGGDGEIGEWSIAERISGEKVGSVYLLPMPTTGDDVDYDLVIPGEWPNAEIEIGYFLKPTTWGRGFATEVCKRILRFAFEEASLPELVASVADENVASQRVLEKSGLAFRERTMCWGEITPLYSITRAEWLARRPAAKR